MNYLSLCSGIEAATTAWHDLGWTPLAFSEIEPFPSAVLSHHWPDVPNLGDMTKWREWPEDIFLNADILVGGTPCQAFSVAGLRKSLDDERGNLTLIYAHIIDHIDNVRRKHGRPPAVCLWENVPGVLNTKDNAFGCFLGALSGEDDPLIPSGRRWTNAGAVFGPQRTVTWRTLDAQYFGVAQRRRRVFLVGCSGDRTDPVSVLFEREGVRRDSPPRREAGQDTSGSTGDGLARCITAGEMSRGDWETCTFITDPGVVTHSLRGEGFDASEDGTGRGTPLVPVSLRGHCDYGDGLPHLRAKGGDCAGGSKAIIVAYGITRDAIDRSGEGKKGTAGERSGLGIVEELAQTIKAKGPGAVAFATRGRGGEAEIEVGDEIANALRTSPASHYSSGIVLPAAVRRLTPTECARLQGFPDHHARIPWRKKPADQCPDGPQYKAYGNSMAVPCMRWLGKRIAIYTNDDI